MIFPNFAQFYFDSTDCLTYFSYSHGFIAQCALDQSFILSCARITRLNRNAKIAALCLQSIRLSTLQQKPKLLVSENGKAKSLLEMMMTHH